MYEILSNHASAVCYKTKALPMENSELVTIIHACSFNNVLGCFQTWHKYEQIFITKDVNSWTIPTKTGIWIQIDYKHPTLSIKTIKFP